MNTVAILLFTSFSMVFQVQDDDFREKKERILRLVRDYLEGRIEEIFDEVERIIDRQLGSSSSSATGTIERNRVVNEVIEDDVGIGEFTGVTVAGSFKVRISCQRPQNITIEAEDWIKDYVRVEVRNGTLHISLRDMGGRSSFRSFKAPEVDITVCELTNVSFSGAVEADIKDIKAQSLDLNMSGASKVSFDGDIDRLDMELSGASHVKSKTVGRDLNISASGASKIELKGGFRQLKLVLSHACKVDAFNLDADDVFVDISGVSKAEVKANKSIKVRASGMSKVIYSGDPETIEESVSGISKVTRR